MRYRKLDANGDYSFGNNQHDFYRDVREAPAQAVMTRLHLHDGEWFLDTADGTAWNTRVLGRYTGSLHDPEIRARIVGTEKVTEITAYESRIDPNTRKLVIHATISTAYGLTKIVTPI